MTKPKIPSGARPRNRAASPSASRAALLILFVAAAACAGADLFSPNRPLRVLSTQWFDIHYPLDARAAALHLAAYADDAYREIAAFLGTEPRLRYPVVLTPDPGSPNGYYTVWPSRRIVLYLAPADLNGGLGYQADDLAAVFRHELAHAVSLSIRPPFQDFLVAAFGDPAGLSFYTTPANFEEGVAIAVEGPGGFGRARDPLTLAEIRQDALEGRFKTFWESAGAWDRYPYGRVPYSYGALFTRYLLEKFGEDYYRELWQRMGQGLLIPGLGDVLFVRGVFRQVYGLSLAEAWEDFQSQRTPLDPLDQALRISPPGLLTALTASGDTLYWADGAARRIRSRKVGQENQEESWAGDASISRLSVSADGKHLLVSRLRYQGGLPRAEVRELDLGSGRFRILPQQGLRDAAYASDGILAIRPDPGAASLVLVRNGQEEMLLPGSPTVSYASPLASPDGRRIYALRREAGKVSIVRIDLTLGASAVDQARRLVLPESFQSIRYLSIDGEETLRFSWSEGSDFSLAELRGDLCRYQTEALSGGVQSPVYSSGAVYCLGFFSEGSALCILPPNPGAQEIEVSWEPLETDPLPESERQGATGPAFESRPYSILPWLLPRFRYPAFRLSSDGLWSVGAGFVSADPAETFSLSGEARWVSSLGAAELQAALELSSFKPIVLVLASDEFSPEPGSRTLRTTRAGLSAAWGDPLYGGRFFEVRAGAEALWFSSIPPDGDPYGPRDAALVSCEASASYGLRVYDIRRPAALGGVWAEITGFGAYILPPGEPGFPRGAEAAIHLRAQPAALALDLYGAASLSPSLSYGSCGRTFEGFSSGASYPIYSAFSGADAGRLYAYADASASPLVLEIQRRLGPIHVQRLKAGAGVRAAISDGEFLHSLYGRLTLSFSPLLGSFARLRPEAWAEAEYAPEQGRWMLRYLLELPF